jgi:tetratricopeptide (TPR) repeat protein
MVRGKVVGPDGQPVQGARVVIEYAEGVTRKFELKTDRRGEFIQIGLQPGNYTVTVTHDKLGTLTLPARVSLGKPAEVQFDYAKAAAAGVDPAEAARAAEVKKLFAEGVTASEAKNYDLAIEKFREAAKVMPECYDCHYNIGYAASRKGDLKEAEAAWLKALELKADYVEALNSLATLYNNQKRFDEAAAMSARAAAAGGGSGGNADAVYNQGVILWNQQKIAEAKAKFEEALKIDPNHPEARFQLGLAHLNQGDIPSAIAAFEKYLEVAPTGQHADQAKALLAQLKK